MQRILFLLILLPASLAAQQVSVSWLDTSSYKKDTISLGWQAFRFDGSESTFISEEIASSKDSSVSAIHIRSFGASGTKNNHFFLTVPNGEKYQSVIAAGNRLLICTKAFSPGYDAYFVYSYDTSGVAFPEKSKAAFSSTTEGNLLTSQWAVSSDRQHLVLIRAGRHKSKDTLIVNCTRFDADLNATGNQRCLLPLKNAANAATNLSGLVVMETGTAIALFKSSAKGEEGNVSASAFFADGRNPEAQIVSLGGGKRITDLIFGTYPGRQFLLTGYFTTDSLPLKKDAQRMATGIFMTGFDMSNASKLAAFLYPLNKPVAGLVCIDAQLYKERNVLLLGESFKHSEQTSKSSKTRTVSNSHGIIVAATIESSDVAGQRYIQRSMVIDNDLVNDLPMADSRAVSKIRILYPVGGTEGEARLPRPRSLKGTEFTSDPSVPENNFIPSALSSKLRYEWKAGFSDEKPYFFRGTDGEKTYFGTLRF